MNFLVKSLDIFKLQIEKLDANSKKLIYNKIQLIKENPYRYKKLHSKNYSRVFRVRLNLKSKETRMIYALLEPNIILVCLLDRKNDYKDLEKYLSLI
jgi:mRNA-degrading endonuclease RelE of RelBE toxin-antitoxin system